MRNTLGKYFTVAFFATTLLVIFGSCDKAPPKTGTLMDYVPENASVVFKISNFESLQADIEANSLLTNFEETRPYSFFSEKKLLFKNLHPSSQSLLCINTVNDTVAAYTFIAKHTNTLFETDSIKNKTVETLKLNKHSFQRITLADETAYSAIIDSVFVVSSSQQLLLNILESKTERDETFKKVYNLPASNGFTALVRSDKVAINDSTKVAFTSWSALDIAITPESFTATGISLATDSIPQLLNVFKGQIPQQNSVSSLVPTDALGAMSFTFNDAEKLQKNLQEFRGEKDTAITTGLFGSVSELGTIQLKNETAFFIKSIDASLTNDALARYITAKNTFRDVEISSFSEPELFQKIYSPLINAKGANLVFQLDNFFVFTKDETSAEHIISSFQNNTTLKNTPYFENTAKDLSAASSLVIYKMQGDFQQDIAGFFNIKSKESFKNSSLKNYPLAAVQFNYDRNFAHLNISCKEAGATAKSIAGGVSEKFNLKLDNDILGTPQLIESKNGLGNVAVQDIYNTLHFISESGKTLWTKRLDSPILGKIKTVEISGGGNKQIAFATADAFYILDRNGKDAKGFPIKFKDKVTQALSVFDYDNNRNYRFVIVQDKQVLMYDKNGKTVKGFGFNKAKTKVVQPPIHIRMGNKDYIVIAEESGKLNILSRVGKSRVTVSKNFNFSEVPITEEDNTFVVITKENTKERISQAGKVSSQKLDVSSSYWFTMNGNTKATLDDNLLRINGKLTTLPLGLYTTPEIFNLNRTTYIAITETQEKKLYVFDKNGTLLKGFPVYGTSTASMGAGNKKSIVVKGEANNVVYYTLN